MRVCMHAERLSRVRLCGLMDHNPLGSSEHGVLQARILDWVAMPCSRGSSDPGIEPVSFMSPALVGGFFTSSATWEALSYVCVCVCVCVCVYIYILFQVIFHYSLLQDIVPRTMH